MTMTEELWRYIQLLERQAAALSRDTSRFRKLSDTSD